MPTNQAQNIADNHKAQETLVFNLQREAFERLMNFRTFDPLLYIERDKDGNVAEPSKLLGRKIPYDLRAKGERCMVTPIDAKHLVTITSRGVISSVYNIELYAFLRLSRVQGVNNHGYHEINTPVDVVKKLEGVVPNIENVLMPRVREGITVLRLTNFHRIAYQLMTGEIVPSSHVVHHELFETDNRLYKTFNVVENLKAMPRGEHMRLHALDRVHR